MSITFTVILVILLPESVKLVADDNVRAGKTIDEFEDVVEEMDITDWADEAVLDVAFYLRLHKFNDFDRRYYMKSDENNSYFHAQFPVPPLITFHWEVYEMCMKDFLTCLKYLQDTVAETQFQRASSTYSVMRQMNWTWINQSNYARMVDDECLRLKTLDWTRPDPFRGPLERFRWRVTASYFMCWYTMQNVTTLAYFAEPCDDLGRCYQVDQLQDFRANNKIAYRCAMYSFCPDSCCPVRHAPSMDACQNLNPCRNTMLPNRCEFLQNQNAWLPSIIYNEWNVSCTCMAGYEWDSRYGMCIDVNECTTGLDFCDNKTETCMNLLGSHKCICRWGFTWSTDQRICVSNEAVKRAEIRFGSRYSSSNVKTSMSIASSDSIWTIVKNVWHRYARSWLWRN